MCGLTGVLDLENRFTQNQIKDFLLLMSQEILHRDPIIMAVGLMIK